MDDVCVTNPSIWILRKLTDTHFVPKTITNPPLSLHPLLHQQQKNTCAHNNTHKAHANGIKKKKRTKYVSTRGMDPKFLRNQKFCKKWNSSKRPQDE